MAGAPVEALQRVPLFADLNKQDLKQVARLFKERRFAEGETVIQEGSGGAAFFVIDSGEAKVVVGGEETASLKPGDYFGEIALIDEGTRSATINEPHGVLMSPTGRYVYAVSSSFFGSGTVAALRASSAG